MAVGLHGRLLALGLGSSKQKNIEVFSSLAHEETFSFGWLKSLTIRR